MKTYLLLIVTAITLVAIANTAFALPSPPVKAPANPEIKAPVAEIPLKNYFLTVSNIGDSPSAIPVMVIKFYSAPTKIEKDLKVWGSEIAEALKKKGGVLVKDDYEKKVTPIILEYVKRFSETGAKMIRIDFPRIKQGIFLYQDKYPQ